MSKIDIAKLGEFFRLLYGHGLSINEHEIAHTINNHLSVLSMQVNMVSRALTRNDTELVLRKVNEITDTAKRIQDFAQSLSEHEVNPPIFEQFDLNNVIQETLDFIKVLPMLSRIGIDFSPTAGPVIVNSFADGVKLLLLSFFHSAVTITENPMVRISVEGNGSGTKQLSVELGDSSGLGNSLKFPMQTSSFPGATPMRQLKRILESETSNLQVKLQEGDCLGMICTFEKSKTHR